MQMLLYLLYSDRPRRMLAQTALCLPDLPDLRHSVEAAAEIKTIFPCTDEVALFWPIERRRISPQSTECNWGPLFPRDRRFTRAGMKY